MNGPFTGVCRRMKIGGMAVIASLVVIACSAEPYAADDAPAGGSPSAVPPAPVGNPAPPALPPSPGAPADAGVDTRDAKSPSGPVSCPVWNTTANGGNSCTKRWTIETTCSAGATASASFVAGGLQFVRAATVDEPASVVLRLDTPLAGDFDVELELDGFGGTLGYDRSAFVLRAVTTNGVFPTRVVAGVATHAPNEVVLETFAFDHGGGPYAKVAGPIVLRVWRAGTTLQARSGIFGTASLNSTTADGSATIEIGIPTKWYDGILGPPMTGDVSARVKSVKVTQGGTTVTDTFACNSISP